MRNICIPLKTDFYNIENINTFLDKYFVNPRLSRSFSARLNPRYRSFATTVSQLKTCDFSGETFKSLKCYNFL